MGWHYLSIHKLQRLPRWNPASKGSSTLSAVHWTTVMLWKPMYFFVKFRQHRRSVKQKYSHSLNNNCIEKLKCRNFVATQKIFTQMKSCCCMTWGYKSYGYTCIFLYSLFCFCSRRKNKDIGGKLNGTYFSCYIIHEKLLRNLWDALITIYFARLWRLRY